MQFKLFSLIALILTVTLVQGKTYMNCRTAKNDVDKCICYLRQETYFRSTKCSTTQRVAKDIIEGACKNISYCRDAYAHNDDFCPKAIWNYSTNSCRRACLTDIQNSLINNKSIKRYFNCLISTQKINEWFCTNDIIQSSDICEDGWRKEI